MISPILFHICIFLYFLQVHFWFSLKSVFFFLHHNLYFFAFLLNICRKFLKSTYFQRKFMYAWEKIERNEDSFIYLFFKVYLFIYLERDRTRVGGCSKRGRERIPTRPVLSAWSLMWGSNSEIMKSWPELKPRVGWWTDWDTQAVKGSFI